MLTSRMEKSGRSSRLWTATRQARLLELLRRRHRPSRFHAGELALVAVKLGLSAKQVANRVSHARKDYDITTEAAPDTPPPMSDDEGGDASDGSGGEEESDHPPPPPPAKRQRQEPKAPTPRDRSVARFGLTADEFRAAWRRTWIT